MGAEADDCLRMFSRSWEGATGTEGVAAQADKKATGRVEVTRNRTKGGRSGAIADSRARLTPSSGASVLTCCEAFSSGMALARCPSDVLADAQRLRRIRHVLLLSQFDRIGRRHADLSGVRRTARGRRADVHGQPIVLRVTRTARCFRALFRRCEHCTPEDQLYLPIDVPSRSYTSAKARYSASKEKTWRLLHSLPEPGTRFVIREWCCCESTRRSTRVTTS